jgi:hypothetical protein
LLRLAEKGHLFIRYDVDSVVIFQHDPGPYRQAMSAGMQNARAAESVAAGAWNTGQRAFNHFPYTEKNRVV